MASAPPKQWNYVRIGTAQGSFRLLDHVDGEGVGNKFNKCG